MNMDYPVIDYLHTIRGRLNETLAYFLIDRFTRVK
jgi:hypothetical protein